MEVRQSEGPHSLLVSYFFTKTFYIFKKVPFLLSSSAVRGLKQACLAFDFFLLSCWKSCTAPVLHRRPELLSGIRVRCEDVRFLNQHQSDKYLRADWTGYCADPRKTSTAPEFREQRPTVAVQGRNKHPGTGRFSKSSTIK